MTAPQGLSDNMPMLVHHLTDNISDQTEQAKAIAVWIATHIAYDNTTYDPREGIKRKTDNVEQSAKQVLKDKIGICAGFADLYEEMLKLAGIKSEKIYGYTLVGASNQIEAKKMSKQKGICGHVWNKVYILGRQPLYVDTTWMARGTFGRGKKMRSEQTRKREIRQNKNAHKSHNYKMDYFDFTYSDLMKQGEYRFTSQRQLIKK